MIDCSHGNSRKQHTRQIIVAKDVACQVASGATGKNILGVMIESNIVEGRQNLPDDGPAGLLYGQSITDACIGWKDTVEILGVLAESVKARKENNSSV